MAKSVTQTKKYISNPFKLTFEALNQLFKTNPIWAIVITLVSAGGIYFSASDNSFSFETATGTDSLNLVYLLSIAIIALLIVLIMLVISTFFQGIASYVVNESSLGKSVSFSEAFNATKSRFWRLFWAEALAFVKIIAWSLLFIIPGIIAAMRYSVLPYLIMDESDKEKGIIDSHDKTKKIIKGRLWEAYGVTTVSVIVPIFGGILGLAGRGFLYHQLKNSNNHNSKKPKIHWLNYLGLWLIAIILLALAIFFVVAIMSSGSN